MKKLTTISLFIFGIVVTAILTSGLVFYQNKKDSKVNSSQTESVISNTVNNLVAEGKSIILDMTEIAKHNKSTDCWMLINSKVYNVTSYFGSHPGGNSPMSATCGKDATAAYMTQNPNSTSSSTNSAHSSNAVSLLSNYYIGDLNQTIGDQNITQTNNIVAPTTNGDDDEDEYEDD